MSASTERAPSSLSDDEDYGGEQREMIMSLADHLMENYPDVVARFERYVPSPRT